MNKILPTEPEVTRAHTNLFLTAVGGGGGVEELRRTQIFDSNLGRNRQESTVYALTPTIFLSSNQIKRMLQSASPAKVVWKLFARCYFFMLYTTRRKRVVVNVKRHSDLFQCADSFARTVKHACSC